ncbi:MAG: hypothetical protein Q8W44_00285 [Candidatus Palauibacterales bacterium]|nr:hypothetical protein [Candidatus Palauibacterales bacterium]
MSRVDGGKTEATRGLPAEAALAAGRAGLPDPKRAFVVGFGAGDGDRDAGQGGDATLPELAAAWGERRHVVLRLGSRLSASDAAGLLHEAGVSAETPVLLASGLGTGRERLLYGSLEDVGGSGFGAGDVLFVPHPAALPMDFAWPPTAAPARERVG